MLPANTAKTTYIKDVVGYYNDYKGNGKAMNFKLDDDSLDKIYDIFEHIEKN